jgi:hypothetical protein
VLWPRNNVILRGLTGLAGLFPTISDSRAPILELRCFSNGRKKIRQTRQTRKLEKPRLGRVCPNIGSVLDRNRNHDLRRYLENLQGDIAMTGTRNNGRSTEGRDERGRFGPGNQGRPQGARHRATLAAEALLDGEAEALTRKCVELALGGDAVAMRLCLERILPVRKGRPVQIELPEIATPSAALRASSAVISAVATGDVTPDEGAALAGLVELQRRAIETVELEDRLLAVEQLLGR